MLKFMEYRISIYFFILYGALRIANADGFVCSTCLGMCRDAWWNASRLSICRRCMALDGCDSSFADFFGENVCTSYSELISTPNQWSTPSPNRDSGGVASRRNNQNLSNAIAQSFINDLKSHLNVCLTAKERIQSNCIQTESENEETIDSSRFFESPEVEELYVHLALPSARSTAPKICSSFDQFESPPRAMHVSNQMVRLHTINMRRQVFNTRRCAETSTSFLNRNYQCETEYIMHKAYIVVWNNQYDENRFQRCRRKTLLYYICDDWILLPGSCTAYST